MKEIKPLFLHMCKWNKDETNIIVKNICGIDRAIELAKQYFKYCITDINGCVAGRFTAVDNEDGTFTVFPQHVG